MKGRIGGLLLAGLMALAGVASVASAVSLDLSYADPASDVAQLWTANMTPVLTDGNITLTPFPVDVNILRLSSADAGSDVTLTIQVKGAIADVDNTSYRIRLYSRQDNASHFAVTYVNGTTTLASNASGSVPIDVTGQTTVSGGSLVVQLAKSSLGAITAWDIDATAAQSGPVYTYQDSGWQLPGSPGSGPALPGPASALLNWAWVALVPVIIAIALVVLIVVQDHRRDSAKRSPSRAKVAAPARRGKP